MIQYLIMRERNNAYLFSEKEKFRDHLDRLDLEMTRGREVVFYEVMSSHGHFTAEDLVKVCKKHKRKISRATIYRTIKELLEASVIRKTAFGEKHEHYEHVYDEKLHHHARCIRCHALIEFPDLKEDRIYISFLKNKGFQILGHEMHFYGICQKCQRG